MKPLTAMAWKEWRESRVFLWIALGVFLVLPIIGALEGFAQYSHHFVISTSGWIYYFGGVLAVFVGVGATCRDMGEHLEDFWRSRPVSAFQWMLVKYLVGLIVVLVGCLLPLIVELLLNWNVETLRIAMCLPFMWAAIYSIAFCIGCLLRRPAQAAMLALTALLLVYYLPAVLPPLQWMDFTLLVEPWIDRHNIFLARNFAFAGGMLGIAVVALILGVLAVRRNWRIESGQRLMYGSISLAILILFGSAAYHLGTNLPILQTIDLPRDEQIQELFCKDQHVFLFSTKMTYMGFGRGWASISNLREIQIVGGRMKLGKEVVNKRLPPTVFEVAADNSNVAYNVRWNDKTNDVDLYVEDLRHDTSTRWGKLWHSANNDSRWPTLYVWRDRLYIIGHRLVVFDIAKPTTPHMISNNPFKFSFGHDIGGDEAILYLPQVPGLPPRQRLDVLMKRWPSTSDQQTICYESGGTLIQYRLTDLTESTARFKSVARYEPTMLDRVFGMYGRRDVSMKNGLLYVSQGGGGDFNPHVTVFDTRGPRPLRIVGHFAAPGEQMLTCPLPDGRAIVAGSKLWLVGPPPNRRQ